jgi:5S rRNA maturation endonuclease (ribonuclease M5)
MNLEELNSYIKTIKKEKILVLVEGIKDKKALEGLGIKKIKMIQRKPLYKVIDEINEKEVVILTDLDKEGKRLYSKLRSALQRKGVKINNEFRNFLFKTELRQIEGLTRHIKKFR